MALQSVWNLTSVCLHYSIPIKNVTEIFIRQKALYLARLSFSRPKPNLEDQDISLLLVHYL